MIFSDILLSYYCSHKLYIEREVTMKKLKKLICSMLSALLIMNLSTTVLADGDSLSRIAEYTI